MAKKRSHLEVEMSIRNIMKFDLLYKDRICTMQELADALQISRNQLEYTLKVMKERSAQECGMAEELRKSVKRLEKLLKTREGKRTIFFSTAAKLGMTRNSQMVKGLFLDSLNFNLVLRKGNFDPHPRDFVYVVEGKTGSEFEVKVNKYLVLDVLTQEYCRKLEVLTLDEYVCSKEAELQKKFGWYF